VMSPPPLPPEVPDPLSAIVMKCLEKDPARRFASVADLARALTPLITTTAAKKVEERHDDEKLVVAPFLSRARILASAITVLAIGLGVCGALRKPASSTTSADASNHASPAAPSLIIDTDIPLPPPPSADAVVVAAASTAASIATPSIVVVKSSSPHAATRRTDLAKATKSNLTSASAEPDIGY
jgi:serine/threonine protein kinase